MQGSIPPLHVFIINEPPHLIFYRSSIKLLYAIHSVYTVHISLSLFLYVYIYIFPFLSLCTSIYVFIPRFLYILYIYSTVYLSSEAPRAVCGGRQAGMVCE